ncbi:MAG TPA: DUF3892 domain-containing protein [Spirochaetia bacterium]|nr:DUF3892 domain-containing protein [Spirochaetia bacterium]
MAHRYQVLCINKSDRPNAHERLVAIGGITGTGSRWLLSQEQAIEEIEHGRMSFFVPRFGKEVSVLVTVSPNGKKLLKTEADGEQPDNLLSLPECR